MGDYSACSDGIPSCGLPSQNLFCEAGRMLFACSMAQVAYETRVRSAFCSVRLQATAHLDTGVQHPCKEDLRRSHLPAVSERTSAFEEPQEDRRMRSSRLKSFTLKSIDTSSTASSSHAMPDLVYPVKIALP